MFKFTINNRYGFALFFTVVIISVISAIAFGLASITLKQKNLSSLAYDSQTAFYAADAGMECALFRNQSIFSTSQTFDCFDFAPNNFGLSVTMSKSLSGNFWSISPRDETCFSIELLPANPPNEPRVSFSVKGYNTCKQNNIRYIERNLRAFF